MYEITIVTDNSSLNCSVRDGESLLAVLRNNGVHLNAECGGAGTCGKCAVRVSSEDACGPRSPEEEKLCPPGSGLRLACQAVISAPLTVTVSGSTGTRSAAEDTEQKGGAVAVPAEGMPVLESLPLVLDPPSLEDQRSAQERLETATGLPATLTAIASAGSLVDGKDDAGSVHAVVNGGRVLDVLAEEVDLLPALAVDIGTTTVAGYLVDLRSRRIVASRSEENRQRTYGADVLNRIAAYSEGMPLTQVIREQIAEMTTALVSSADLGIGRVMAAAVVGNPTMIHLVYGLSPETIGRAPFMPLTTGSVEMPLRNIIPGCHPEATVLCAPAMSGYVGADIIADVIACDLDRDERTCLLIDVGTNGEMVLKQSNGILACSTAAGPAFEGASIRCGSGAVDGAISRVRRAGDDLEMAVIGNTSPRTVSGTGLIDAVAAFLEDGILDETGRLAADAAATHPAYRNRFTEVNGEPAVVLADEVVLTQADIRQLQLAKGAIAAGVRSLLAGASLESSAVERVYLAGGFGSYVQPDSAVRIGLLPGISADRVVPVGNAAGAGAVRLLADRQSMNRALAVANEGRYLELSSSAAFQSAFVDEMMFP